MKKPKIYQEKFNRIKTQTLYWEFIALFEHKLKHNFNCLKVNIPSFSKVNNFQRNKTFYVDFARKITFDSVNNYEVYSLLKTKKFELFETLLSLFDFNDFLTNKYLGLYSEVSKIERDKKVEDILEIETKIFEVLISFDINDKNSVKTITFDFYSVILEFLANNVNIADDEFHQLELPNNIPVFKEEKERNANLNFTILEIQKDLLLKNGIILWKSKKIEKYDLLSFSAVNNEIKTFFTIEKIDKKNYGLFLKDKTEKLKTKFENNKYYFISLNISEIMIILLEKYSSKELFSFF